MTAFISPPPRLQFFTNAGVPMASGLLYTYAAGTTTPLVTYTDSTGLVANTNPVILDSRGEASIWLGGVGYKFKLATPANVDVWTQDNIAPGSSAYMTYTPAGTGAVTTTVQAKLRESVSVKDFGAVGDGVTDDFAAITLALAASSGRELFFPAGTYKINFAGSSALTPLVNCSLVGENKHSTILDFVPSSTSFRNLFNIVNNGFSILNFTVSATAIAASAFAFFKVAATSTIIDNCIINGGATNVGAVISRNAYGILFPDAANATDLYVKNTKLTRLTYPLLKNNAATSTQTNVNFINNWFTFNYYNDLGFNTPNGVITNVLIDGNKFDNNQTIDSVGPAQALGIALASVSNFVITNNILQDKYTDAIHIEEDSYNGTISNNVIHVDGNGIEFNGNNIGGTLTAPSYITVCSNSIVKTGTLREANKWGIRLIYNASLHPPANNIVISSNVVNKFEWGLYLVALQDTSVVIDGNLFSDHEIGIVSTDASVTLSNNVTSKCDAGVGSYFLVVPGTLTANEHTFIDCVAVATNSSLPVTLLNPKFIFAIFDHPGTGAVYKNILVAGANDRAHGFFEEIENCSGVADYSRRRDLILWDGATFTVTNQMSIQPGAVTLTSVRNAGILAVNVNSAVAKTNMRLQVKLNGMAVVAI